MDINERVLDKLDKIDERLNKQDVTLVKIQTDVAYHIHRTDLAEENIVINKKDADIRLVKLEKWYDKFHYLGWVLFAVIGILEKMDKITAILHSYF